MSFVEIAACDVKFPYMRALRSSLCLTISERFGSAVEYNYGGRGSGKHLLQIFEKKEFLLATVLDPRC